MPAELPRSKIAAAAETYFVQIAPHNSGGPVSAAMAIQIAAVVPNFHVLETVHPEYEVRHKVGGDAMEIQDGYIHLNDSPGLGLADLDLSVLKDEAHGDEPVYAWRAFSE